MIRYCTTDMMKEKYAKCCGPVAVANLVREIACRRNRRDLTEMDPARMCREIARIGERMLAYWNVDFASWMGGTADHLSGLYIEAACRHYGLKNVQASRLSKDISSLPYGTLVYIILRKSSGCPCRHLAGTVVRDGAVLALDGRREEPVLLERERLRGARYRAVTC